MKQKYLRAKLGRLMTKDLHKSIMKHSRLRNKFLHDRTEKKKCLKKKCLKKNTKQRNFCLNLLKKSQKTIFCKY